MPSKPVTDVKHGIKVPEFVAAAALAAILSLQGWMLLQISHLDEKVAGLSVRVEYLAGSNTIARHERHDSNTTALTP
jgi:hypothetical protein